MSELDPEIRAMAEENKLRWPAPYAEPSIARARASYTERYRARSLPPTSEVIVERLTIPGPAGPIAARTYVPAGTIAQSLPVLVYFHGGGFVLGEADGYELQSMRLAELMKCMVLFPEFRLAPEHPFPAAVHDTVAVVRWCAQNARALGADSRRLAVAGDSAGGNLALNACIAARDAGFPSISFQCLLYPHADFRPFYGGPEYESITAFGSGFLLDRVLLEWFAGHYLPSPQAAQDPRASPILTDLSGLPRTAIITAECDPLRDMGAELARCLRAADVPVAYRCMSGLAHNFMGHVKASSRARTAFDEVTALIQTALESG